MVYLKQIAFLAATLTAVTAASAQTGQPIVRNGDFEGDSHNWWAVGELGGDVPTVRYVPGNQCSFAVLPYVNGYKERIEQEFLMFGSGDSLQINFRYRFTDDPGLCTSGETEPDEDYGAWFEIAIPGGDPVSTYKITIPYPDDTDWHDFCLEGSCDNIVYKPRPRDVVGMIVFGTYYCNEVVECVDNCAAELHIDEVEICRIDSPVEVPDLQPYQFVIPGTCGCPGTPCQSAELERENSPGTVCPTSPCLLTGPPTWVTPVTLGTTYKDTTTGDVISGVYCTGTNHLPDIRQGDWYKVLGNGARMGAVIQDYAPVHNRIWVARALDGYPFVNIGLIDNGEYDPPYVESKSAAFDTVAGQEYFIFVCAIEAHSGPYTLKVSDPSSLP